LQEIDNTILTPHVGRRTFESVDPKALRAVRNVVGFLKGGKDFIQPTSSSGSSQLN
jgi:phosphoglycerate dehydrogenase-like enzyme